MNNRHRISACMFSLYEATTAPCNHRLTRKERKLPLWDSNQLGPPSLSRTYALPMLPPVGCLKATTSGSQLKPRVAVFFLSGLIIINGWARGFFI